MAISTVIRREIYNTLYWFLCHESAIDLLMIPYMFPPYYVESLAKNLDRVKISVCQKLVVSKSSFSWHTPLTTNTRSYMSRLTSLSTPRIFHKQFTARLTERLRSKTFTPKYSFGFFMVTFFNIACLNRNSSSIDSSLEKHDCQVAVICLCVLVFVNVLGRWNCIQMLRGARCPELEVSFKSAISCVELGSVFGRLKQLYWP